MSTYGAGDWPRAFQTGPRWPNALVHRYESVSLPEFQRKLQGFLEPWKAYLSAIQQQL
jgi:hypothetical protein